MKHLIYYKDQPHWGFFISLYILNPPDGWHPGIDKEVAKEYNGCYQPKVWVTPNWYQHNERIHQSVQKKIFVVACFLFGPLGWLE